MHKIVSAISASFFVFIGWIIYLANTGQKSIFFDLVASIPYGDKVGHFCLFGGLTLAANFLLKFKRINVSTIVLYQGSVLVFILVLLEELSQYFVPTRTLDSLDLLADTVGILLFNLLSKPIATYTAKN